MARVTAYEATDGSLHRDKKDWLRHESNLIVAQKLHPLIEGLIVDGDEATRQASIADVHDFIVNGIGLNTLRELFAIQFKPGAEDGDAGTGGAPAAGPEGGAPAAGEGGSPAPADI